MRTAKEVAATSRKESPNQKRRKGDPKLAENIASLRASHNLALRAVGAETGVAYGYISQLEKGYIMPGLKVLVRLAAFYDVTLDDLAGHLVDAAKNGDPS